MTDRTRQKFLESFRDFLQRGSEFSIGIDPDKGFAVWDYSANDFVPEFMHEVDAITILKAVEMLQAVAGKMRRLVIEAPYKNKAVWGMHRRSFMRAGVQGRAGLAEAVAKSVGTGKNMKVAQLLVDWAKLHGLEPYESRPNARSMTKLSAEKFLNYTGCVCKNEHVRDACMLVFDRR